MAADRYHYHEVLDRAAIIENMIDELLEGHPAVEEHPKTLGSAVRKLQEAAAELYQLAGRMQPARQ